MKIYDCIIVGGGPAGLTSALYLKRFNRDILLIDKGEQRIKWAPRIRNLIGYKEGIPGKTLLKRLQKQAEIFGVESVSGEAQVYRDKTRFRVSVGKQFFWAKFVVLATGIKDVQPPHIDCYELCARHLVAYCPVCDGFEHINKKVGLLIGSQSGLKKISFFYGVSRNLHVIYIGKSPVPLKYKNLMKDLNVRFRQGELLALIQKGKALQVRLKGKTPFLLDSLYVELGIKVSHQAIRHLHGLEKSKDGRFVVSDYKETSIPRLYAVGDCVNTLAQVSVAIGEAAIAATHIHNRLGHR